jgi:hypothetical protein
VSEKKLQNNYWRYECQSGEGADNRNVIGKHKRSNDNRMRLIHFAASRNVVVGRAMFEHKDIQKRMWKSPDGNVSNQIDHILIDARHCSDLMDGRSSRGPSLTLITI